MKLKTLTVLSILLLLPQGVIAQRSVSSIREVDFRNFTYPMCIGTKTGPLSKAKSVSLRGGVLEVGDLRKNEEPVDISLSNVSYHDLTGDGWEEAIVSVGYSFYPKGSAGCTFIYTPAGRRPRLIWQEGVGSLRRLAVETQRVVLEKYIFSASDASCCPRKFSRAVYRWNGKRFHRVRRETLANDYEDSRFLGYP